MPYPTKVSISRPCPTDGGKLFRRTDDPKKPLGMIACSTCGYTSPIQDFAKALQADRMAKAKTKAKKAGVKQ
jgi:DNA-directed RNA polymerase subunit M/transcription elongation factor TFIIS